MDDSMAGPFTSSRTYLSPKVLQPIPRLKKTVSNRRRRPTRSMILTSSPYKQDLVTSINKKGETDKVKKKISLNMKNESKKAPKKTAQKKRKIPKDKESSPESSDESDYSVNDSTDKSPDCSQNGNCKCLYWDGIFSEGVHGEKWILVGLGLMKIVLP
ncbi:hypothetical protein JTB14_020862 [Gonioctena quinquepunctata]|nr:hypothetical protein JTB14_020862 [Gonioctena quinquepunctata]